MTPLELDAWRWRKLLALVEAGDYAIYKSEIIDKWGNDRKDYFDGYVDLPEAIDKESDGHVKVMEEWRGITWPNYKT